MILVIGLGNPGIVYQYTRHNIGFIAIERIANKYHLSFSTKQKFNCKIAEAIIDRQKICFIKPTTYMNLSGKSVILVKTYYNINYEKVFVIHDDIDLEIGRIKFKTGGSNGGHNGLKSIDSIIGSHYNRIRIGIGRPQNNHDVADYVLSNFSESEYKTVMQSIDNVANNFGLILEHKLAEFKNKIV
ncbi:aminoacyl-tRNA hydrolase [Rickettsia typhi]|uniref:Peptidyl-tRNA hydrolase n=2 Tax=Rickettsia typhi TaxID=785 RepID=PTH_RICTY|nr:aminoacyl-tRNA hydrolase [Rickettsia typhi]Q68WD4.1 RecName: Full=Peptidyl-tRNA hydrolase; Short=PTH [Rickettsia typhi str. Wilmington]AAU04058.1 Peptidyl-tRNA hydrolase [Rickettsia typhi str. Wilmington]AFE54437.1 peptidyl-tRNA hydrolase [Rickettsia typhi str. TH1527]AFE55275.1 peptidyl-tRNA hydrolase [Rickettsia typhi str. B9991CWPP]